MCHIYTDSFLMYVWLVMIFNPQAYKPSMIDVPSVHSTPEKAFQRIQQMVTDNPSWELLKDSAPNVNQSYCDSCYVHNDETSLWIQRMSIDFEDDEDE